MISKEQLADAFSAFGLKYGSRPSSEIADGLSGPELRVFFPNGASAGTMVVRERTIPDLSYDEFDEGMTWAVFMILADDPDRLHPYAGSSTMDELVHDMVVVYTTIAGASNDAESVSVDC
jgi:hypothetical protein